MTAFRTLRREEGGGIATAQHNALQLLRDGGVDGAWGRSGEVARGRRGDGVRAPYETDRDVPEKEKIE